MSFREWRGSKTEQFYAVKTKHWPQHRRQRHQIICKHFPLSVLSKTVWHRLLEKIRQKTVTFTTKLNISCGIQMRGREKIWERMGRERERRERKEEYSKQLLKYKSSGLSKTLGCIYNKSLDLQSSKNFITSQANDGEPVVFSCHHLYCYLVKISAYDF